MIDDNKGIEVNFDSKEPFNNAVEVKQEEVVPIATPPEHSPVPQHIMQPDENWSGRDEVNQAAFGNKQQAVMHHTNSLPVKNETQENKVTNENDNDVLDVSPPEEAIAEQAIEDAKLAKANQERLDTENLSAEEYEAKMQKLAEDAQKNHIDEQRHLGPNNQNALGRGNDEGLGE